MATIVINTNSWVTIVEADTYLDEKVGASAWAALTDEQKSEYLITAFRWINRLPDYDFSVVTNNMKYAQIELAWYIYGNYTTHTKHEALYASGVRNFRVSKFTESLAKPELPPVVKDLLDDYDLYSGGYFPTIERDVEQNG